MFIKVYPEQFWRCHKNIVLFILWNNNLYKSKTPRKKMGTKPFITAVVLLTALALSGCYSSRAVTEGNARVERQNKFVKERRETKSVKVPTQTYSNPNVYIDRTAAHQLELQRQQQAYEEKLRQERFLMNAAGLGAQRKGQRVGGRRGQGVYDLGTLLRGN